MVHELRVASGFFRAIRKNLKRFEIRKFDANYKVGDFVIFREVEDGELTGRKARRRIRFVFKGSGYLGLESGYCILGL